MQNNKTKLIPNNFIEGLGFGQQLFHNTKKTKLIPNTFIEGLVFGQKLFHKTKHVSFLVQKFQEIKGKCNFYVCSCIYSILLRHFIKIVSFSIYL